MGRTPYRHLRGRLLSELKVCRQLAPDWPGRYEEAIFLLQRALVALRRERYGRLPRWLRFLGGGA